MQPYRGSGAGGQKRNKTSSAIRLVHRASGAVGQCENFREQSKNKAEAFKRMSQTKEFQNWMRVEAARASGELDQIIKKVEEKISSVLNINKDNVVVSIE